MYPTNATIIVAHPDDDALFAGPFQIANPWIRWQVVSATYTAKSARGRQLIKWQKQFSCDGIHFLGLKDAEGDLHANVSSFSEADVINGLKLLKLNPSFILTHSVGGEYGHPHHRTVCAAVRELYKDIPILTFAHFSKTSSFTIEVPDYYARCVAAFPEQAQAIRAIHLDVDCCRVGKYTYL